MKKNLCKGCLGEGLCFVHMRCSTDKRFRNKINKDVRHLCPCRRCIVKMVCIDVDSCDPYFKYETMVYKKASRG